MCNTFKQQKEKIKHLVTLFSQPGAVPLSDRKTVDFGFPSWQLIHILVTDTHSGLSKVGLIVIKLVDFLNIGIYVPE